MLLTGGSACTCGWVPLKRKFECAGPGLHLNTAAVLASTKSRRSSTKYRGSAGDRSHLSMASVDAVPHTRSARTPHVCWQPWRSPEQRATPSGTLIAVQQGPCRWHCQGQ